MKLHEIKIEARYARDKNDKIKSFEIRKNDREYEIGDLVVYKVVPDIEGFCDFKVIGKLEKKVFRIVNITDFAQTDNYIVWQEKELK